MIVFVSLELSFQKSKKNTIQFNLGTKLQYKICEIVLEYIEKNLIRINLYSEKNIFTR